MINKKRLLLIGIPSLMLFLASCNNNNTEDEGLTPISHTIKAYIGDKGTRAGIVEENENYKTEGEKFYWVNGDKIATYFESKSNGTIFKETYIADVKDESEKSNSCDLVATNPVVPAGNYSAKAYFPSDQWDTDENGNLQVSIHKWNHQPELNSKHLGDYIYMTAENNNVNITGNGDDSFPLNFNILNAVFRIRIKVWESFLDNKNRQIFRVMLGFEPKPTRENPFPDLLTIIPTKAQYQGGKLVPIAEYMVDTVSSIVATNIVSGADLSRKIKELPPHVEDGKTYYLYDVYIPVLPFNYPFGENDYVRMYIKYKEDDHKGFKFSQSTPITIKDAPGLKNGVKAGTSYSLSIETPTE